MSGAFLVVTQAKSKMSNIFLNTKACSFHFSSFSRSVINSSRVFYNIYKISDVVLFMRTIRYLNTGKLFSQMSLGLTLICELTGCLSSEGYIFRVEKNS